jgi:hypothetical protein
LVSWPSSINTWLQRLCMVAATCTVDRILRGTESSSSTHDRVHSCMVCSAWSKAQAVCRGCGCCVCNNGALHISTAAIVKHMQGSERERGAGATCWATVELHVICMCVQSESHTCVC